MASFETTLPGSTAVVAAFKDSPFLALLDVAFRAASSVRFLSLFIRMQYQAQETVTTLANRLNTVPIILLVAFNEVNTHFPSSHLLFSEQSLCQTQYSSRMLLGSVAGTYAGS